MVDFLWKESGTRRHPKNKNPPFTVNCGFFVKRKNPPFTVNCGFFVKRVWYEKSSTQWWPRFTSPCRDGSSRFHELCHLSITNSTIWISPTVPSKFHEFYHLNITNSGYVSYNQQSVDLEMSHLEFTNSAISVSRTFSLNIMNPTKYESGTPCPWCVTCRDESSRFHELCHLNSTSSVIWMLRTLLSMSLGCVWHVEMGNLDG